MNNAISEKRQFPRVTANFPVRITPDFLGKTIDLSEGGLRFALQKPLLLTKAQVKIELSPEESIETEFKVVWNKHLIEKNKFVYGVCFIRLKEKDLGLLKKILERTNIEEIEGFFGIPMPEHIKNHYRHKCISDRLDQHQIMKIIDFTPPFLKIDKIIIFDRKDSLVQTTSLGAGIVTTKDTSGHYNDTIFLAMCGMLMATSASIHLAVLFPPKAPQVIEASGVKPLLSIQNNGMWRPSNKGTSFLVETNILRKKLQLVIVKTNVTFGKILYGTIEELKLVLTQKESIHHAKEIS